MAAILQIAGMCRTALCLVLVCLLAGCGFFGARVNTPPPKASVNKIVKTASTQIGKKYSLGNASPHKGFDCSGLVWWSYGQHGVKVPRITSDQAKAGSRVPAKKARAGDIVVFKIGNSPRGLHTGIYAGGGKFIHSPCKGKKVCMQEMDSYWSGKLISVRRVVR